MITREKRSQLFKLQLINCGLSKDAEDVERAIKESRTEVFVTHAAGEIAKIMKRTVVTKKYFSIVIL